MRTRLRNYGAPKLLLSLFLAGVASAASAFGQATQQFTGHVLDASGAAIQKAEVTVHNQATGVDNKTATTDMGIYTVPYLIPGTYTVTATKAGFATQSKTDIKLNIEQTSTIDFNLTVGAVNEQVTVNASGAQVELSKSDRGEVIDQERVNELPLDARNPYGLFGLTPGTHDFSNSQYPRPFDNVTGNQYSNGAPQNPSLSLDGISNDTGKNSLSGFSTNSGIVPSVDSVQEFKVVLNAEDASYGRGGGSSIDVALKTGTNQLHGIFDYYKRGSWLDTYGWANKYSADTNNQLATKNPHNRNQFSLELDGPIVIPHLFNGRNKLFFTVSYEEMLEKLPNTSYSYFSIPNPAWVNGDFSTATYWNSATQSLQPLNIYDPLTPLTPVVDPHDGQTKMAHAQFAGNIIPASRLDPVGVNILKDLIKVTPNNNPGPGYAPFTNNWRALQVENDTWRNALVKVDYVLSNKDRLAFRWSGQGRWANTNNYTGWPDSVDFNMSSHGYQPKSETGSIVWTHTINDHMLFDFRTVLMTQANDSSLGPQRSDNALTALGFSSSFVDQVQNKHRFPTVEFDGQPNAAYTLMGYWALGSSWHTHALDFLPTLTWIKGQHTVRTGIDIQLQQSSNPFGGANDYFQFGSQFTNQFYGNSDAPNYASGSSWASAALGYPYDGGINYNVHDFEWAPYFAPWVQDDWKVSSKLTLNLGFRWDFQVPRTERRNKANGIFNTAVVNPVSSQLGFAVVGGTEFAGVNGQSRRPFAMNWYDIQPRIGFAYALRPTTSIRGGVAKNYQIDTSINGNTGFNSYTRYNNSTDGGLTPYTATTGQGLKSPYASVTQPSGSSLGYLTNLGNSFTFYNPKYSIPSFWSYHLTLETALTARDIVSVAYVGNLVPDGPVTANINAPSPAFYQQCNGEAVGFQNNPHLICDNNTASNTTGFEINPFLGNAAFSGSNYYNSARITRADETRPYFGWGDIYEIGVNNNYRSWYNSFQVTAKHQVSSKSLSLYANYTHATSMHTGDLLDTSNQAGSYPNTSGNKADYIYKIVARQTSTTGQISHAFNFSGVAYLPFGHNRQFLSNANRFVDELVNGWQISPLLSWYSGFPWRPSGNWEWNTNVPMGMDLKTLAPDGNHNFSRIRGVTPCVGTRNIDTGAVVPSPAATAAGCTSIPYVRAANYAIPHNVVDFGVKQPGGLKFDLSLAKSFTVPYATKAGLSEATILQLRVDMLNALNHADWDMQYNNDPTNIDWGTIAKGPNGPTNNQRYLQLSAKLSF